MKKLVDWALGKGRASRREFWLAVIAYSAIAGALVWLISRPADTVSGTIVLAALVVIILGFGAVLITLGRRLHDIGHSFYWVFAFTLPAKFLLMARDRFTEEPAPSIIMGMLVTAAVAGFAYAGLRRGTDAENRFGPAPSATKAP